MRRKDVKLLVKYKFGRDLSPGQEEIVRKIAFLESKRISIRAPTRYGKTQCVADAISLILDFGIPYRIAFIGPMAEQAAILRQYMADNILADQSLLKKAQLTSEGEQRIGKEASRKRMTFSTGAEYRVFSAEGEANRLMGFGADIIIKDESCLIPKVANSKIMRMAGDNPENAIIIELMNPWDRDNVAFEHTMDPEWDVIHIDWRQAVREGRTTQAFVDEQRKELTPLEFTVLYESEFPEQGEDSLFSMADIKAAEESGIHLWKDFQELKKKIAAGLPDKELREAQKTLSEFKKIISCDPADKGRDELVQYWGITNGREFEVIGYYSEPKSENMEIANRILGTARELMIPDPLHIKVDAIGIGTGPVSRIKEVVREQQWKNITVVSCKNGEAAMDDKRYPHKDDENYFRLKDLFKERMIKIPKIGKLRSQLSAIKWKNNSVGKREVVYPEDSPDFADALMYFVWKDKNSLVVGFL